MISRTDRLRALMTRLETLQAEHNRQGKCPSRGYNEDAAIDEMRSLDEAIETEMDALDNFE
jgi:hypothetical protein